MRGWCPFAVRRPTNNFGYPQGATGTNKPLMFCDHTMGGWKRTLDDAGWREPNGVGVHFGIGMDGSKSQYTNIFDASWGNGVSGSIAGYDRKNRHLGALEKKGQWKQVSYHGTIAYALVGPGGNLPSTHTISIEHEDGAKPDPIWTPAQLQASIEIKQWCLEELAREGMPMVVDDDALIGHFQIDAVNRAHCPGTNWPKNAQLAALHGGRMYTDEEIDEKVGQALALGVRNQTNLQNLANATQEAMTANKANPKHEHPWWTPKGMYYIAGKAWPF